jgi:hypothetical protein
MSRELAGIVAAQLLYAAIGAGLLPVLRIAPTRGLLVRRIGLSYLVGVAAVGILAAHLALVDAPIGLVELVLLAVASLALGWRRLRRSGERIGRPALRLRDSLEWAGAGLAAVASIALLVLLGHAARAYAARPLKEWDGWAIWATKAKALYEFGGAYEPVFTSYQPVAHPLFLPSLEAIGFRAMGTFDGTLIHVQLIALALGFAAALWSLLGDRVPAAVLAVGLLAVLSASPVLAQLSSNLADVPLAFLCSLGVVCLGRFLVTGEGWTLVAAALFLGAAMLTKSEGLLFAAAAFLAVAIVLAAARDWRPLGHVAAAAGASLAILLPWRLYLAAHDLRNPEYRLSDALDPGYLADRRERVSPAASRLWEELWSGRFGFLVPLALVAVAAAFLAGRPRLGAFALLWPALAFAGLVLVYWISVVPVELTLTWTAGRVIMTLVVGAAALAPLLAGEAWPATGLSAGAGGRRRTTVSASRTR